MAAENQRSLVLIKPDGVSRGLIGEIIGRFERATLAIVALELRTADAELVDSHYPRSEKWLTTVGNKTLKTYREYGIDSSAELGTSDPLAIGRMVKQWLIEYLTSGPVVATVVEGPNAVDVVRKMVGDTMPLFAQPGSIRGDFSIDSPILANREKRPVHNLIHASGAPEEATEEIALWFPEQ